MISRRMFLQQTAVLHSPLLSYTLTSDASKTAAQARGKRITHLHDGGFENGGSGWQLSEGAAVDTTVAHSGRASLRIRTETGDYARFLVCNPRAGAKYTVSGWVKTERVRPLRPGGGAFYAAAQYEFQARPAQYTSEGHIEEQHLGNIIGDTEWMHFHQTFTCLATTTWFEVAIGIYRGSGTAWFDDVTFVEGDQPCELADAIEQDEALFWSHTALLAALGRKRPRAAVLRDHLPVRGTASDPERLATLLGNSFDTAFVTAEDLEQPERFNRRLYDLLVLPYGETFPLPAASALRAFLSQGGDLLTTGGYAFLSPVVRDQNDWRFDDERVWEEHSQNLVPADFSLTISELVKAGWNLSDKEACSVNTGEQAAAVRIEAGEWGRSADWHFTVAAGGPGKRYCVEAKIRAEAINASQGGYGYLSLEQRDSRGYIIYAMPLELKCISGTTDWQTVREIVALAPQARQFRLRFGLRSASGTILVKDLRLEERRAEPRLNTATGFPQDELVIQPEQIGVFDPDYRLKRVAYIEPAPGQRVFAQSLHVSGEFSGYAACGVLGINNARWMPLLNCYDRYGRLRGAAGAMMQHYNGPYARGTWAFFGVDNVDLFASGSFDGVIPALGRAMARKCYLRELETDLASYRDGETVRIQVKASNFGLVAQHVRVDLEVKPEGSGSPAFQYATTLRLAAGQTSPVTVDWKPARFEFAEYRVEASLLSGAERIDQVETGFLVWKEETLRSGAPIQFQDNYVRLHSRAMFLQGTDDYIYMFLNRDENPLTMQAVACGCRDACVDIYENLMGMRGPQHNPPLAWWRWVDSMMLSMQRAGGVFMPGMLIFSNTAVSDADLEDQKAFCRRFAERYRTVPGLIYYLNGDLELHDPNLPDLQKLFREYLLKKYGSEEQLRKAWEVNPPATSLSQLRIGTGTDQWRDIQTVDSYQFRAELVRRWLGGLSSAIRTVDTQHPITAEFYQASAGGIDLVSASDALDFANFGYFDRPELDRQRFPAVLKFLDQNLKGKGVHAGEFGVKTHPAWKSSTGYLQSRSETYEQKYFLELTHTAFGQGAAKVQNWSWKYPSNLPFEWGINYSCDNVPRDVRAFYRNSGILLRSFRPVYHPPSTVVLMPDQARKGGQGQLIYQGLINTFRLLIDARITFGTLEDLACDRLPQNVRTIFYPLSYNPPDAVFSRLERFVRNGGNLYLSGDISYDELRLRTKINRLRELCGVAFEQEIYPGVQFGKHLRTVRAAAGTDWPTYWGAPGIRVRPSGAAVLAQTEDGVPAVTENRVGEGRVLFTPDPFETHAPLGNPDGMKFYAAVLRRLGIEAESAEPSNAPLHVYRIGTEDRTTVHIVVNHGNADLASVRISTGGAPVSLSLGGRLPGVAAVNTAAEAIAVEGSGEIRQGERLLVASASHLIAIAGDHRPLIESRRLLLLPMGTGSVTVPNRSRWSNAAVWIGGVEQGRWKTYERFQPTTDGPELRLDVDADRNLSMIVIAESGDENAVAALAENMVLRPWAAA
jgi:hypothetical protein